MFIILLFLLPSIYEEAIKSAMLICLLHGLRRYEIRTRMDIIDYILKGHSENDRSLIITITTKISKKIVHFGEIASKTILQLVCKC